MKYIYDGSTFSEAESQDRVNKFVKHWEKYGFGMWLLQIKSNGKVAGYAGLRFFEDERPEFKEQVELGYIIDEPYWGRGYASEAVNACIELGFGKYQLERVLATILPDNIASQKVAVKAGMKHIFNADFDGLNHYIYEARPEFNSQVQLLLNK